MSAGWVVTVPREHCDGCWLRGGMHETHAPNLPTLLLVWLAVRWTGLPYRIRRATTAAEEAAA